MSETAARSIKSGIYGRFTVTRASLKDGTLGYLLAFPYDDREVARIRRIPGAKWMQGNKQWFVPAASDTRLAEYLAIETRAVGA